MRINVICLRRVTVALGKKNPTLKNPLEIFDRINSRMDKGVLTALVTWIHKTDKSIS